MIIQHLAKVQEEDESIKRKRKTKTYQDFVTGIFQNIIENTVILLPLILYNEIHEAIFLSKSIDI
jgi:hypothetical protein